MHVYGSQLKADRLGREIVREYFHIPEVTLPIESLGECSNWKHCGNFYVVLGNGLCIDCYDKGFKAHRRGNQTQDYHKGRGY